MKALCSILEPQPFDRRSFATKLSDNAMSKDVVVASMCLVSVSDKGITGGALCLDGL